MQLIKVVHTIIKNTNVTADLFIDRCKQSIKLAQLIKLIILFWMLLTENLQEEIWRQDTCKKILLDNCVQYYILSSKGKHCARKHMRGKLNPFIALVLAPSLVARRFWGSPYLKLGIDVTQDDQESVRINKQKSCRKSMVQ